MRYFCKTSVGRKGAQYWLLVSAICVKEVFGSHAPDAGWYQEELISNQRWAPRRLGVAIDIPLKPALGARVPDAGWQRVIFYQKPAMGDRAPDAAGNRWDFSIPALSRMTIDGRRRRCLQCGFPEVLRKTECAYPVGACPMSSGFPIEAFRILRQTLRASRRAADGRGGW